MMNCMEMEIALRRDYIANEKVESIYFGGGTPSLIDCTYIERILLSIHNLFDVSPQAEITLEANPDDMDAEKIQLLKKAGINRISLGIQSFSDSDLQWMNRAHNAAEAIQCLKNLQLAGFTNISADLIYGVPGQTDEQWLYNMHQLITADVAHISCYALTVEPKTELFYAIQQKKSEAPGEEQAERQYRMLHDHLTANGYIHYEISNFAKPGFTAKHNSSYWAGATYLGIGPSAHSYNGISRQWNISNNALYMQSIQQNTIPAEIEMLTTVQQANEMIMVSLRTSAGLFLPDFKNKFGEELSDQLLKNISEIQPNSLIMQDDYLIIAEDTRFISDTIISTLFIEE